MIAAVIIAGTVAHHVQAPSPQFTATITPEPVAYSYATELHDLTGVQDWPEQPTPTPEPTLAPTEVPLVRAAAVPAATIAADRPVLPPLGIEALLGMMRAMGWPEHTMTPAEGRPHGSAIYVIQHESSFNPGSIGYTCAVLCLGLLQLDEGTWPRYCGNTNEQLLNAWENLACGLRVYEYDISRGQPPWWQWGWTRGMGLP